MNSIDRQQPEANHADLAGADAIAKIRQLAEKAETCFFSTAGVEPGSSGARPMAVQQVDDAGCLWFLSADDSHKNHELERDPRVTLYFQASAHAGFLIVHGTASVSRDRAKIEELWQPLYRTWFTEGIDDPRITLLKVATTHGHYWDTKHGRAIAGLKMLVGAAIGRTLDDSIEGALRVA